MWRQFAPIWGAVDDLAQEVFLRAFQAIDRLADVEVFGAFRRRDRPEHGERTLPPRFLPVRSVTWSLSMRQWKLEHRAKKTLLWIDDGRLLDKLRNCLSRLPQRSRRILDLRYQQEKRSAEIGDELGMNGPAVRRFAPHPPVATEVHPIGTSPARPGWRRMNAEGQRYDF